MKNYKTIKVFPLKCFAIYSMMYVHTTYVHMGYWIILRWQYTENNLNKRTLHYYMKKSKFKPVDIECSL